jgi:uncharacterized protein YjiK
MLLLLQACESQPETAANGATTDETSRLVVLPDLGYPIQNPSKTYTLPGSLAELSGMQSLGDSLLACVQDEKGSIFLYDLRQEAVVAEIPWGEDGDYEGIAGNERLLWVLKSDGTLYRITHFMAGAAPTGATPQVKEISTTLASPCDAEGLCLMPDAKTLLIACKEGMDGERIIWKFNTEKEELVSDPYLRLQEDQLEEELISSDLDKISLGLYKFLNVKGESGLLAPSGLAFHPLSGELYILSAASKTLTILDKSGNVKGVQELPSQLFPQPESITFMSNGTMIIGNEGKGVAPTILLFTYDKT